MKRVNLKIESVTESGFSNIQYDNVNKSSKGHIKRDINSVQSEIKSKISKILTNNSQQGKRSFIQYINEEK
jgi:hypothetical protein